MKHKILVLFFRFRGCERMKTKPGYKLLSVAGEHMVVPLEIQNTDFHAIITLNKTGAFLWRLLQKECTEEREFMK